MTAKEAIERADAVRPNAIAEQTKLRWLRQLDMELRREVLDKNAVGSAYDGVGLDVQAMSPAAVLLAPYDLAGMYVHWLCAQVDLSLGELDRYAADAALYNTARSAFAVSIRQLFGPRDAKQAVW